MSSEKAYMDTFRKCAIEGGQEITVGPDCDGLGAVRIFTEKGSAAEYWGKIDLNLPPVVARMLAQALLLCADELDPP